MGILDRLLKLGTCSNFSYFPVATFSFICLLLGYSNHGSMFSKILYICSSLFFFILLLDIFFSNWNINESIPDETEYSLLKSRKKSMIDTMMSRRSNRSFQNHFVRDSQIEEIQNYCKEVTRKENLKYGENIRIEHAKAPLYAICLRGAKEFLVGIIPKNYDAKALFDLGEALQKVVIKCESIGVNTCWVGGFRPGEPKKHLKNFDESKDHVGVLVAIGYKSSNLSFGVRLFNRRLYSRIPINELFSENEFGSPMKSKTGKNFDIVMNCTRRSPSASNGQYTRILKIGKEYHFYGVSDFSKYYSKLGVGISFANFEIACEEVGIKGETSFEDPGVDIPEGVTYVISWVQKE